MATRAACVDRVTAGSGPDGATSPAAQGLGFSSGGTNSFETKPTVTMSSIASQGHQVSARRCRSRPGGPCITRPSVLFDAKEAADIDHRAILPIAFSGACQ